MQIYLSSHKWLLTDYVWKDLHMCARWHKYDNMTRAKWLALATLCGGAGFTITEWRRIEYLGVVRGTRAATTVMKIATKYLTEQNYNRTRSETHAIAADMLLKLCLTNKGVYIKVSLSTSSMKYTAIIGKYLTNVLIFKYYTTDYVIHEKKYNTVLNKLICDVI